MFTGAAEKKKCGRNKFCVGFEKDRVYCYGASDGCLWNKNDCTSDEDCTKYSTESAKYTDDYSASCSETPPTARGWAADACECGKLA